MHTRKPLRQIAYADTDSNAGDFKDDDTPSSHKAPNQSITIRRYRLALAACIFTSIASHLFKSNNSLLSSYNNGGDCIVSLGGESYKGNKYTLPGTTVGTPTCLVESKWMRLAKHSVRLPSNDGSTEGAVVDDWLFIDYHDRINVLVEAPRDLSAPKPAHVKRQFIVLQQTKYSLEGLQSLAVVGGIIEPGEDPIDTAKREVYEELNGIVCKKWIRLGRFRTDVNRGMGWVHSMVAVDCSQEASKKDQQQQQQQTNEGEDQIGASDTERQDQIVMSMGELIVAAGSGKFLEAQWSNTVFLAMAHPGV